MWKYFSLSCMFCWVLRPVKYNIIQAGLTITSNHNIVRLFKLFTPSSTLSALSPRYLPDRLLQNLFLTSSCVFYLTLGCVVNCRTEKDLPGWVPCSSCLPFLQESQRSSPFNGGNYLTTCSRTWWLISPWPEYWLDVVEALPVSRVLLPN